MKRHRFTWHGICGVILLLLLSKVQESGDDASHTTIHIVDKGIEHTGTELEGHNVIIGDGSWDENYSNGTWHKDSTGWWYSDGSWYASNQYLWIDGVQYYFNANGYVE